MILSCILLLQPGFTQSLLVSSSSEVNLRLEILIFLQGTLNCYFKLFLMPHKTYKPANSQSSSAALTGYFHCTFYFFSPNVMKQFLLVSFNLSHLLSIQREQISSFSFFPDDSGTSLYNSIHALFILSVFFGVMECSYGTKPLIGYISFPREATFASVTFDAWCYSSGASCGGWTWCAADPQAGHGAIHPHQPQHCKWNNVVQHVLLIASREGVGQS